MLRVVGTDRAVYALRDDDEITIGEAVFHVARVDRRRKVQANAKRFTAPLQQIQQHLTRAAGEAVAADEGALASVLDGDVGPVCEVGAYCLVRVGIGAEEFVERVVGEHDAEAERVVGLVLLVNVNHRFRHALLGQEREVEPSGPTADNGDLHSLTTAVVSISTFASSSTSAETSTTAMQGNTLPSTSRQAAPISASEARYSRLSVT